MNTLWQDVRYAVRTLTKSPGFTLVAVLTLALGIGANATIFTWLNSVLLNPLPGAPEQGRLVSFHGSGPNESLISVSYPDFRDFSARTQTFEGITVCEEQAFSLATDDAEPERVYAQLVSGNFFDVLGVRALHGRTFLPEEDKTPETHPVVVISYGLWQRRFGGDLSAVGRAVRVNNHAYTIIGVTPPEFQGSQTGLAMEAWVPMMMQTQILPGGNRLEMRGNRWLTAIARLKPGVSIEQAQAEVKQIAGALAQEFPQSNEGLSATIFPFWKSPNGAQSVLGPVLLMLMGVVGLVLLIACANIANLMLARATGRRKEIAIRLALGASRGALVRQLLTESTLLALLSGVVAVLIAVWTSGLLVVLAPPIDMPIHLSASPDARVLGFALLVSLLTGILFGLAPALNATRPDLVHTLKDEAGTVAGGGRKGWLRNGLVLAQVSLSLLLLVAAGLFLRSLNRAQTVDTGFNPKNVLLTAYDLFPNGYDAARGRIFHRQLLERLATVPGIESVSLGRRVPLGFGGSSSSTIHVEGYEPAENEQPFTFIYDVAPNYLRTMQIPLVRGRELSFEDTDTAPLVGVINETLAGRYWKDQDPIGRRIRFGRDWVTIVGIARNSKYRQLNERPVPMIFLSVLQFYRPNVSVHVRTAGDPLQLASAVTGVIRSLDPTLPVYATRRLEDWIGASFFQQRMASSLLGVFGLLALMLAAVGIYAVMAFSVAQRTREIGIRMALGAGSGEIQRMVLRQGMRITLIGLVIGVAAAAGVTQLMRSLLFGIQPTDLVTYASVVVLLAAVAAAACWIPARRATRVDPIVALRYE